MKRSSGYTFVLALIMVVESPGCLLIGGENWEKRGGGGEFQLPIDEGKKMHKILNQI